MRLQEDARREKNWKRWGPYLAERQWGTVREDYSRRRQRLGLLPARPRAQPRLPLGRGRPARASATARAASASRSRCGTGATRSSRSASSASPAPRATTARTSRSSYFYLDATPTHSYMQGALQVPAARVSLRASWSTRTARRGKQRAASSSSLDTGVFDDDRYFDVFVEYAKAAPDDVLIRDHRRQPRARGGAAPPAAHALVPQHLVAGGAPARATGRGRGSSAGASGRTLARASPASGRYRLGAPTDARPSCCSPRTRPTPSGSSARRTRRRT